MADDLEERVSRIVVPRTRRMRLLQLAHDRLGHLGHRKVISVLKKRFTWPGMSEDVERYVLSCDLCQRANKQGHRKVPMVER